MREIKFRAWYQKSQNWLYLKFGQVMSEEVRNIYNEICSSGTEWQQYTGFRDKNGTEIYEGDIVKHEKYDHYFKIKYEHGRFIYYTGVLSKCEMSEMDEVSKCEIVGNICESTELKENVRFNSDF